ncbi:hypothetical protein BGZ65_007157, partial [Modicella reniformis]
MCIRVRTRLRSFACFCTFLGLTIAAVGMLRARYYVDPNFFWLWNFSAESLGMVALTYTIVSVGNGFYPMAGAKNVFWRMAMSLIIIYALVATANIAYYVQQKVVHHHISGAQVQVLRNLIIREDIRTEEELLAQEITMQCLGLVPHGNRNETGVDNWTQLTWAEREMYSRPVTGAYLTHQMLMLLTTVWASFYLFIPLVRNHRHGPVGRPVDSDMMAVGVWYLSCLMLLMLGYAVLNIYYCFNLDFLYEQQAQALDLCIRITIAPVFILPAPPFLIRFYRQRFNRFIKCNNTVNGGTGSNYGSSRRNGGTGNSGCQGSFMTADERNGSFTMAHSPEGPPVGRVEDSLASKRTSLEKSAHLTISGNATDNHNNSGNSPRHTSIGSAYGGVRLFHSRTRGTSSESNKIFSQDFEQDPRDSQDYQEEPARPDSFDQYYNNMSSGNQISSSRYNNEDYTDENKDPLSECRIGSNNLQKPEPVLIAWPNSSRSSRFITGYPNDELASMNAASFKEDSESVFAEKLALNDANESGGDGYPETKFDGTEVKGTTGWEIGGWNHHRQTSESMKNSLSNPVEPNESLQQHEVQSPISDENDGEKSTVINIENRISDDEPNVPPVQQLTGLQKQLAEYRSALLPVVLAMHDDMQDYQPPSATYDNKTGDDNWDNGANDPWSHRVRGKTSGRFDINTASNNLSLSNDESSSSRQFMNTAIDHEIDAQVSKIDEVDSSAEKDSMLVHSIDPMHWAKLPPSPKLWPATSGNTGYIHGMIDQPGLGSSYSSTPSAAKSEKPVAGFRKKWLAGRKSNEPGRQGLSKKFELDYAPSVMTASTDDSNKSSKRISAAVGAHNPNTDAVKSGKSKDARRRVFSKVLSVGNAKGGDRGRPSQDILEQDRDYSNLELDGKTTSATSVPATVEALALASAILLDDEDEDKGLQYYYPDPYYSLAEFKRPQSSLQDQGGVAVGLDRNTNTTPMRHPLSPTISETSNSSQTDGLPVRKSPSVGNISAISDYDDAAQKCLSAKTKKSFGKGTPSSSAVSAN